MAQASAEAPVETVEPPQPVPAIETPAVQAAVETPVEIPVLQTEVQAVRNTNASAHRTGATADRTR